MNLLWFWMLDPPRGGIIDQGETAAFTQHLRYLEGQELEASLFLDEHGEPHFVKVLAHGARDIYDTDRFVDLVAVAQQHMLSLTPPKKSGLSWATLGNDGSKKPRSARHTGLFWANLGDAGKLVGPPDRNRTCI